jgi:hypothetical protein
MSDWRLTNQKQYLDGARLTCRMYAAANPENDHDHCEFCFAKFMANEEDGMLHEGYATDDNHRWICKTCYEDFKSDFNW